jgi:hypothetical protein
MLGNHLFINLENHIDLTEFDKLRPEICRGVATASHFARNGLHTINDGTIHPDAQGLKVNPLYDVYATWNALPEDDPLKIAGKDLDYNQLTTYLKYAFGAYDLYSLYVVLDDCFNNVVLTEINDHFPELTKWILNFLENGTFSKISSATIMMLEAGGLPWEHCDPEPAMAGKIAEFIHIKTDLDRPFYIIDPKTNERVYMNTRVAWWDETDWHGGEPISRPTFTLRINGRFTEEFKKKIM